MDIQRYVFIALILVVIAYLKRHQIYRFAINRTFNRFKRGQLTIKDNKGKTLINIKRTSTPQAEIVVNDTRKFYEALVFKGEVGLGEAYTEQVWNTPDLASLCLLLMQNYDTIGKPDLYDTHKSTKDDYSQIQHHYDVGNDFYKTFLTDQLMAYTCAFWFSPTDDLNKAQFNKVNTIIRKLNASPGQRILDVGCGWGQIADYIQKQTKTNVTGITLSKEQVKHIQNNVKNITALLTHYNELNSPNTYDRIYSIGMLEAVRAANMDKFMQKMAESLKPGGRMVIHSITSAKQETTKESGATKCFITTHIFPGGQIPFAPWVVEAAMKAGFKLVHKETYGGLHYAKTLRAWRANLLQNYDKLKKLNYKDKTIRAYDYYFAICEAAFWVGNMDLTHFVFDKVDTLKEVTNVVAS